MAGGCGMAKRHGESQPLEQRRQDADERLPVVLGHLLYMLDQPAAIQPLA